MIRDSLKAHPPGKISDRFDFSYLTLTESQKELLHRMAAFASSVTEEAIQTVCMHEYAKGGAYAARVTPDDLGELVRRSFVDRIEIPFKIEFEEKMPLFRYRLHPLMRQYTTIKANKAVLSEYRAKAALYFHDYADHFHEDFDKLEIERDNILAGMDWAVEQLKSAEGEMKRREAATLVLEFIRSVYEYLDARGYWNEAQLRLHQAIDAARETDDKNQLTYSIHNCGIIEQKLGDYSEAYRLFLQILKLGDKIEVAASLHELGILAYLTGNSGEAWRLHQQSLEIMRKLENKNGEAKSLHQLGLLAQDAGHYDEARELYLQSLEIKKSLGDRRGVAMSLNNLGMLAQLNDNYDLAMKLYRQSLKIKRELQDDSGVAKSLHNLGTLAQFSGNYDEARTLYLKSLEIKKKLGDKMGMAASLHQLGALAKDTGKYDEARNHYQQSLEIKKRLGDKKGMASTLALLALLDEAEGDISAALEQMKAAEAIFRDLGSPEAQKAQEDRERLEARLKK
jgi:tetratricopeptide (TPR) repeat protein